MTETEMIGGYISVGYISAHGERYSLILAGDSLESRMYLPGLLGESGTGALILDDGAGNLHTRELYDTDELIKMVAEQLGGRTLTSEEKIRFKAR